MTEAEPLGLSEAEHVARIIDPEAFKTLREIAVAVGLDVDTAPSVVSLGPVDVPIPNREFRRVVALSKAAVILARSPPPVEGLKEAVERVRKRAAEIEEMGRKFPSWSIGEAQQHAADLRIIVEGK